MLNNCLQLMIVFTPNWQAVNGQLFRFERAALNSPWVQIGSTISVVVGKNGMAWGKGLHETSRQDLRKKEGDLKTPAGFFSLGAVFGNESHQKSVLNMPFLLIDENLEGIDDPSSCYYNTIVNRSLVVPDWKSSEKMKQVGFLYSLGLVIEHNAYPIVPYEGSCIFMHIWREVNEGTAGCTAMAEKDMCEVAYWLNQKKSPRLVQLPQEEYFSKNAEWQLPSLH